jgi:Cu(I)/Ag(I) efflux system membrane protein CusA/SilA
LPLAVLSTFIIMRLLGIEANVVALSGIAIAIGVVLDVGIVMVESILKEADISKNKPFREVISVGVKNISAPLITGMVTTLISFLPVLALTAQEGKLFKPLAYTKTFTMAFALLLGFTVLPTIAYYFLKKYDLKKEIPQNITKIIRIAAVLIVTIILTAEWTPLGYNAGFAWNLIFVVFAVGIILAALWFLVAFYEKILSWCLGHKLIFLVFVSIMVLCGLLIWKGMGQEFMPSLDEGDFLLMPTSAPHSGVERNLELIAALDRRISAIPEIENTVGKWGRVNSALDPAPVQMFENVINYKPEYALDSSGKRVRQWREHIKTTDDIWQEIAKVSQLPGLTSSPKLHPIAARQVMLATGMRAAMGLKISGPSLEAIELGGKALEAALKEIPAIESNTVFYDRSISAPYLEIRLDRVEMARYGLTVTGLQDIVSAAVGGMTLTTAIDGIERFPVRLRYPRELRNNPEALAGILIPTETGAQIPLGNVAKINYAIGAQMIRSENTFLIGYIIFDKMESIAEVDAVLQAKAILDEKVKNGELALPSGVSYKFAGSYEQQQHATARLKIIIPIALIAIFLVLFYLFRTVTASCIHFSGIIIAFAGGFFMLWLYDQSWFLNFSMGGENLRHIFHIRTVNLSVAVWVGFIALFGISTNDGVLMGTYIHETFKKLNPQTKSEIKAAVIKAGLKRVRPAAMTTATTLIALLPVLTSTGKGSDIMVPMAIPAFGGMLIQSITMFTVPVLQCAWRERVLSNSSTTALN